MNKQTITPNDEFAKSAMQTYMQICEPFKVNGGFIAETEYQNLAKYSYEIADAMMAEKYKRDTNLCNDCKLCFSTCNSNPEFGLSVGFDNVIKCDSYMKKREKSFLILCKRIYFYVINFYNKTIKR